MRAAAVSIFLSAICTAVLAWMSGCTTGQQAQVLSATYTGTRIAACVESVLAEEEQHRALTHRLAEIEAEQEAERIRNERVPSTVKEEIEKVLKDGGAQ